jgi:hypothetical protein
LCQHDIWYKSLCIDDRLVCTRQSFSFLVLIFLPQNILQKVTSVAQPYITTVVPTVLHPEWSTTFYKHISWIHRLIEAVSILLRSNRKKHQMYFALCPFSVDNKTRSHSRKKSLLPSLCLSVLRISQWGSH